jgi:hypothetical protein
MLPSIFLEANGKNFDHVTTLPHLLSGLLLRGLDQEERC